MQVVMVPKDWTKTIAAGATYTIQFGGTRYLPSSCDFKILSPLAPGSDNSLNTRGNFGDKVSLAQGS